MIVSKGSITEFKDIKKWHDLIYELSWIIDNSIHFIEENEIGFDNGEDFLRALKEEISAIEYDRGYKKEDDYL